MPDSCHGETGISRIENRSIVSLKVAGNSAVDVRDRLQLAAPRRATNPDPNSLWLAPDHWLLVSDTATPDEIIKHCCEVLSGIAHLAIDQSSGLIALKITGPGARELLAADCGLDLRPAEFPAGTCCRTRLARIAAVVVADGAERLTIYLDRSYETYIREWLTDTVNIAGRRIAGSD